MDARLAVVVLRNNLIVAGPLRNGVHLKSFLKFSIRVHFFVHSTVICIFFAGGIKVFF